MSRLTPRGVPVVVDRQQRLGLFCAGSADSEPTWVTPPQCAELPLVRVGGQCAQWDQNEAPPWRTTVGTEPVGPVGSGKCNRDLCRKSCSKMGLVSVRRKKGLFILLLFF